MIHGGKHQNKIMYTNKMYAYLRKHNLAYPYYGRPASSYCIISFCILARKYKDTRKYQIGLINFIQFYVISTHINNKTYAKYPSTCWKIPEIHVTKKYLIIDGVKSVSIML